MRGVKKSVEQLRCAVDTPDVYLLAVRRTAPLVARKKRPDLLQARRPPVPARGDILTGVVILRTCTNDQTNAGMCGLVWLGAGRQCPVAGSSFPRGRLRHEEGHGAVRDGHERKVYKSPRVAGTRG